MPEINASLCNKCGLCYQICPGHEFISLESDLSNSMIPDNELVGNNFNIYLSYSTNHNIRYNAASGGVITTMLIHLLDTNQVSGVIVAGIDDKNPLRPKPTIAKSKDEVIKAMGSKYCPVPMNYILKEVLNSEVDDKFAIVGLPCHIHGIRKAQKLNKVLREKIILLMGLVCNHTPSFLATEFLLKKKGLKKSDIKRIAYRGKGWPGGMQIIDKNSNEIFIPHFSYDYWGCIFGSFFYPIRCISCTDKICRFSDISFADAWIPEQMNQDSNGVSLIITRSQLAEHILNELLSHKKVMLIQSNVTSVIQSQSLVKVRERVRSNCHFLKLIGKKIPLSYSNSNDVGHRNYIKPFIFYVGNNISYNKKLWPLLSLYCIILKSGSYVKKCVYSILYHKS